MWYIQINKSEKTEVFKAWQLKHKLEENVLPTSFYTLVYISEQVWTSVVSSPVLLSQFDNKEV